MTDKQMWSKWPPGLRDPSEGGWRSVDSLSNGTVLVSAEERQELTCLGCRTWPSSGNSGAVMVLRIK